MNGSLPRSEDEEKSYVFPNRTKSFPSVAPAVNACGGIASALRPVEQPSQRVGPGRGAALLNVRPTRNQPIGYRSLSRVAAGEHPFPRPAQLRKPAALHLDRK